MIARKAAFPSTRATALGLATALALTAIAPSVVSAASPGKGFTATTGGMTDISARRRGFNPGAAAAVAGVVGLGIAAAAAANSNAYYGDSYGSYGGGPGYYGGSYDSYDSYGGSPAYYGSGGGYGGYGYGGSSRSYFHGHPIPDGG